MNTKYSGLTKIASRRDREMFLAARAAGKITDEQWNRWKNSYQQMRRDGDEVHGRQWVVGEPADPKKVGLDNMDRESITTGSALKSIPAGFYNKAPGLGFVRDTLSYLPGELANKKNWQDGWENIRRIGLGASEGFTNSLINVARLGDVGFNRVFRGRQAAQRRNAYYRNMMRDFSDAIHSNYGQYNNEDLEKSKFNNFIINSGAGAIAALPSAILLSGMAPQAGWLGRANTAAKTTMLRAANATAAGRKALQAYNAARGALSTVASSAPIQAAKGFVNGHKFLSVPYRLGKHLLGKANLLDPGGRGAEKVLTYAGLHPRDLAFGVLNTPVIRRQIFGQDYKDANGQWHNTAYDTSEKQVDAMSRGILNSVPLMNLPTRLALGIDSMSNGQNFNSEDYGLPVTYRGKGGITQNGARYDVVSGMSRRPDGSTVLSFASGHRTILPVGYRSNVKIGDPVAAGMQLGYNQYGGAASNPEMGPDAELGDLVGNMFGIQRNKIPLVDMFDMYHGYKSTPTVSPRERLAWALWSTLNTGIGSSGIDPVWARRLLSGGAGAVETVGAPWRMISKAKNDMFETPDEYNEDAPQYYNGR